MAPSQDVQALGQSGVRTQHDQGVRPQRQRGIAAHVESRLASGSVLPLFLLCKGWISERIGVNTAFWGHHLRVVGAFCW